MGFGGILLDFQGIWGFLVGFGAFSGISMEFWGVLMEFQRVEWDLRQFQEV